MKQRLLNMYNDPRYSKLFEWGKLLSITGIGQIAVQATGFISGILVIRLLSTEEYALYTLANTMLGTMTLLADGGIASGVMAEGGRVWKDREKLGAVMTTGINLRKKFAVVALLIAMPILVVLLRHNHASWLMTGLIIISLIPAFVSTLSNSLLQIVPKLHQDIKSLQKNQVEVNILRLILSALTLFIFPWAFVAVLASGLPQIWSNKKLHKISDKFIDRKQKIDEGINQSILVIVKRTLPGSIYYCVTGQITIWLLSIFGTTQSIAHVGAIGRLTILLNIVGIFLGTLFEPRFSRLPDTHNKVILSRFFQIQGLLIFISFLIVFCVWLFPDQIILILGNKYKGLNRELLLMTISSCLALVSGSVYKLSSSRGIIPNPVVIIPMLVAIQILFFIVVDYTQVTGVLMFSIFTFTASWLIRVMYFLNHILKKIKMEHAN